MILKPAQYWCMILNGKGCLTGCALHGWGLVLILLTGQLFVNRTLVLFQVLLFLFVCFVVCVYDS